MLGIIKSKKKDREHLSGGIKKELHNYMNLKLKGSGAGGAGNTNTITISDSSNDQIAKKDAIATQLPASTTSSSSWDSARPPSRHSNQPRLGMTALASGTFPAAAVGAADDDVGIMSEAEISASSRSSSRKFNVNHPHHHHHHHHHLHHHHLQPTSIKASSTTPGSGYSSSSSSSAALPRTSPGGYTSSIMVPAASYLMEDDAGIMSEAETSSTYRISMSKRGVVGRHSIPMGALTLNRQGFLNNKRSSTGQRRSVQFRHPIAQHSGSVPSHLFEDDPGIMSEVETVSTSSGRRRQQQQQLLLRRAEPQRLPPSSSSRSAKDGISWDKHSLPIVRTPSKTLERPLGLVFLIYRGETKRALLPNEITSLDTVKALFVRSFGKLLTMEYMDSPRVKIYIHDNNKDIFYELENLSEIKDRTILKMFEADNSGKGPSGLGPTGLPPITNNTDDLSMSIAPTAESEYVGSWHVKAMKALNRAQRESDMILPTAAAPGSSTLPRPMSAAAGNAASTAAAATAAAVRSSLGERSKTLGPGFLRGHRYNASAAAATANVVPCQQGMGGRTESGYVSSPDGNLADVYMTLNTASGSGEAHMMDGSKYYCGPQSTQEAKERMMHMEAQLSQLTGMVEKALKGKKLGTKKTVSFDKSVSYSDDLPALQPVGILSNKRQAGSGSNGATSSSSGCIPLPTASTSSTSSCGPVSTAMTTSSGKLHSRLRVLQKSTRDLRQEVKVLRRLTQLQSMAMKDLVQDTYLKLREACIAFSVAQNSSLTGNACDLEIWRVAQDEDLFQKEMNELVRAISQLEAKVEETRSGVINKKNKILLADVESMALVLSKSSRTVTQLKRAFPILEAHLKAASAAAASPHSSSQLLVTEDFLKRTPDRLDNVWKRCKKLTGTLVTLKRLASVQEQRFHPNASGSMELHTSLSPTPPELSGAARTSAKESTLDDLLDALQSYSGQQQPQPVRKPSGRPAPDESPAKQQPATSAQAPDAEPLTVVAPEGSSSSAGESTPVALEKKNSSGSLKGTPPPPPPRTSSAKQPASSAPPPPVPQKPIDIVSLTTKSRQDALELRHQELLLRQKQLQEQYQRLQQMQNKKANAAAASLTNQVHHTASDSGLICEVPTANGPEAARGPPSESEAEEDAGHPDPEVTRESCTPPPPCGPGGDESGCSDSSELPHPDVAVV